MSLQENPSGTEKQRQRRNDRLLGVCIILAAILCLGIYRMTCRTGAEAVVYINGERTAAYPLREDAQALLNGTNLLVIRGGMADITEADCQDKLCVRQAAISRTGESLVCLPNRIVVVIEGDTQDGVDAQTN